MIFERYRDLFEDCAPAFWPWVWVQLAVLLARKAADGRDRLIMVTWWGWVVVLAVGDDPHAPRAWKPAHLQHHVRPLALAVAAFERRPDTVSTEWAMRDPARSLGRLCASAGPGALSDCVRPVPNGRDPPLVCATRQAPAAHASRSGFRSLRGHEPG